LILKFWVQAVAFSLNCQKSQVRDLKTLIRLKLLEDLVQVAKFSYMACVDGEPDSELFL